MVHLQSILVAHFGSEIEEMILKHHLQDWIEEIWENICMEILWRNWWWAKFLWGVLILQNCPATWETISTLDLVNGYINSFNNFIILLSISSIKIQCSLAGSFQRFLMSMNTLFIHLPIDLPSRRDSSPLGSSKFILSPKRSLPGVAHFGIPGLKVLTRSSSTTTSSL